MVELCCHLANVVYLVSYLGRDMLWLRVLTCMGLALGIVFFTCQPTPLYGPTAWHLVFLLINAYQIRGLVLERRRLALSKKQQRVGEAAFHEMSREELLTALTHSMTRAPDGLGDVPQICRQPMTKEEAVLRDIAFSRLSRGELLNLLTRRMWNSIVRKYPAGWRRQPGPSAVVGPRVEAPPSSAAG